MVIDRVPEMLNWIRAALNKRQRGSDLGLASICLSRLFHGYSIILLSVWLYQVKLVFVTVARGFKMLSPIFGMGTG